MQRFTFLLVALFLLSGMGFAQQRSAEEAAALAAKFVNGQPALRRAHRADQSADQMRLAHTRQKATGNENAFYIFNRADQAGFIIVSADERTADEVLAYSEKGAFNMQTVNPNLRWWLERMQEEISSIPADEPVAQAPKAQQVDAIAPLLKNSNGQEIAWYQEAPYYNLCPMDQRDNTRCLTGCVATAASMIMYKWRWPVKGTGSSSYTWYDCLNDNCQKPSEYKTKILSANYGETTYDWDNMLPSYQGKSYTTAQGNAVATLMYHAGVASEMQYGGDKTGGSGTLTDIMAYGLINYFGYKIDKFISMYAKNDYYYYGGDVPQGVTAQWEVTVEQIKAYFNADLEAGRPIIMGGEDSSSGGHEFVCDGRDTNGRFHINWGWEGDGNCYTALTTLKPDGSTYRFNGGLDAIIGLEPNKASEAVENTIAVPAAEKIMREGQILIQRGGSTYSVLGQTIQ